MEPVPEPPPEPSMAGLPPTGPVMDVLRPPAAEPKPKAPAGKPGKPVAPPKPAGNGVTAVIIATVIIVLGLALLTVYAYLKTRT